MPSTGMNEILGILSELDASGREIKSPVFSDEVQKALAESLRARARNENLKYILKRFQVFFIGFAMGGALGYIACYWMNAR